ncbi:MAG: DHHA1 domain-containing protein, partial [Cyanobacteria bacterium P01_A01_bin.105]
HLTTPLLELFTLGTIADLAPLTGVNRRWVRRGLSLLPRSHLPGIQALIEIAGLGTQNNLKPEAIGFRLGPRINAVGRIADPQIVIEMLTTDDIDTALDRALKCEETNKLRQRLCEIIEQQAVEWCEAQQAQGQLDLQKERVLVIVQPDWHHGVIGIVASRLVERYGVPVFIGTYEDSDKKEIRGSARSIPEFNVFEALQACDDLMEKYGGHRAAGGFSFAAKQLRQVKTRLSKVAHQQLQPEHLKPLVTVDVQANLADATFELYEQIDQLHPCGMQNPDPVFWTAGVNVVEQQVIGKDQNHLKLTLSHTHPSTQRVTALKALAWRWGEHHPLPRALDIAYKLRINEWRGEKTLELEIVGVRLPKVSQSDGIRPWSVAEQSRTHARKVAQTLNCQTQPHRAAQPASQPTAPTHQPQPAPPLELPPLTAQPPNPLTAQSPHLPIPSPPPPPPPSPPNPLTPSPAAAEFFYGTRRYISTIDRQNGSRELKIQNAEGHLLVVKLAERQAVLHLPGHGPQVVDLSESHYFSLLRAGLNALELKRKTTLLIRQDELLTEKDSQITTLTQQVQLLEEKISQLSQEKQTQFKTLQTELKEKETAIHHQEAHIVELHTQVSRPDTPPPDPKQIKQAVRTAVGDSVWFCIQPGTQKDLFAAYKNAQMIAADGADPEIADYSEAGIRLGFAVEREIVTPFFKALYEFLLTHGGPEIGGIQMGPSKKYTIGMMPSLLATSWKTLRPDVLKQATPVDGKALYKQAKAHDQVGGRDRTQIADFLDQWEHPMAACFSQKGKQAAASIDQIGRLRNLSAHGDSFLYRWHYSLLKERIVGSDQQRGLFRQIYGG